MVRSAAVFSVGRSRGGLFHLGKPSAQLIAPIADRRQCGLQCRKAVENLAVLGLAVAMSNDGLFVGLNDGKQSALGPMVNLADVAEGAALLKASDVNAILSNPRSGDLGGASKGCVATCGGGLGFGLRGASFASKGCCGGGDVGGSGHGLVWLGRASLPADVETLPKRLGDASGKCDFFNLFSENRGVHANSWINFIKTDAEVHSNLTKIGPIGWRDIL